MKKMGKAFETAVCKGCGRTIFHVWWGNAGTIWEHEGGQVSCARVPNAHPIAETVEAVEDE